MQTDKRLKVKCGLGTLYLLQQADAFPRQMLQAEQHTVNARQKGLASCRSATF